MPLFSEPLCPQCGQSLPMRKLWKVEGSGRLGLLQEKCGIVCSQCGMRLRIFQAGVGIYDVATIMLVVGLGSPLIHLIPVRDKNTQLFLLLLIGFPIIILLLRFAPCFARVAEIQSEERIKFPLSSRSEEPESAEVRGERELAESMAEARNSDSSAIAASDWKCASCGEVNPGQFNICWKCQKSR
jgi:hypothetical protein